MDEPAVVADMVVIELENTLAQESVSDLMRTVSYKLVGNAGIEHGMLPPEFLDCNIHRLVMSVRRMVHGHPRDQLYPFYSRILLERYVMDMNGSRVPANKHRYLSLYVEKFGTGEIVAACRRGFGCSVSVKDEKFDPYWRRETDGSRGSPDIKRPTEAEPDALEFQNGSPDEMPWISVARTHAAGKCIIKVRLQASADDLERFARADVDRARAEAKRRQAEAEARFGPPLNAELTQAGFDPARFNIAFIGTNNSGKSTFANALFMDDEDRSQAFEGAVRHKLQGQSAGLDLLAKYKSFFTQEGRATTWEMVQAGRSQMDVDLWFPRTTFWDLPGIELKDAGVQAYLERASVNHFDAAFLMCDRQLSTDDFFLILQLQKAQVDGKPSPVPFFIIRTKMDLVMANQFTNWVKEGGWARKFELDWCKCAYSVRETMLADLPEANKLIAADNPALALSEDASVSPSRFFFSGLPRFIAHVKFKNAGSIPFSEVDRVCRIFDMELESIRRLLQHLTTEKFEAKLARAPAMGSDYWFDQMKEALLALPPRIPVPDRRDIEVEVEVSSSSVDLGFAVRNRKKKGDILVKAVPAPLHGLEVDDEVVEFPKGRPVESTDDLTQLVEEMQIAFPFTIVVARGDDEEQVEVVVQASPHMGRPQLGFGITLSSAGDLLITAPPAGCNDLRQALQLKDGDVIAEFPTNCRVESIESDGDLVRIAGERQVDGKLSMVVSRRRRTEDHRCFLTSNFRRFWASSHRGVDLEEYSTATQAVIAEWAKDMHISQANAHRMFKALERDRSGDDVAEWAENDWTSAHQIMNAGCGGEVEFCTMLSAAFRSDKLPVVVHAITVLSGLRDKLVRLQGLRAQPTDILAPAMPWPANRTTYRGTAMPQAAFGFFKAGVKYRVPWPLATSVSQAKALDFKLRSSTAPGRDVAVCFEVDVSEEPYHCNHVDSAVPNEFEFLFMPYSCFKVVDVTQSAPNDQLIRIKAYKDNKPQPGESVDSDEWDIASWH